MILAPVACAIAWAASIASPLTKPTAEKQKRGLLPSQELRRLEDVVQRGQ